MTGRWFVVCESCRDYARASSFLRLIRYSPSGHLLKSEANWGLIVIQVEDILNEGITSRLMKTTRVSSFTLNARDFCLSDTHPNVPAGSQMGTVIMLSSSGFIASSFLGWPSIFYVSGTAGLLWSVLWFFYGANSPSEFKSISAEEKSFIEKSLQSKPADVRQSARVKTRQIR